MLITSISTVIPSGVARVCNTEMVCGWVSGSTRKRLPLALCARNASPMASAAAVASSSSEPLAISIAVRSVTNV